MSRPSIITQSLPISVSTYATGFGAALSRMPAPKLQSPAVEVARPRAISVRMGKLKVKVRSHLFAPPVELLKEPPRESAAQAAPAPSLAPAKSQKYTRIKPPRDIVKLSDRLFYVLQPPMESLIGANSSLRFPFQPFPYQWEGIAFLYPRYSALIADEMGLGKTMQTITAIRMLLRSGEIRSVALVCPKPLVSNWQREFAQWAPEIPILAVGGDAAKRKWQWHLPGVPVKIANYELLLRDREVLTEGDLHFDLAVLDEAQRIKNRGSSTASVACAISRRRSWAMTGTPVENHADDLVGIFEFLAPGYLNSNMKPGRMGRLAGEYVIRRTKQNVLKDLPPKMFRDADIELLPEQRETYRMAEEEGVVRLKDMGHAMSIQHVFELVLRLKQICNFDPATGESAKLERLEADLEEVVASGQKAIIFSQWVNTLEEMAKRIDHMKPLQFHGKIPHKKRAGVIDEFRENKNRSVLLLSYGAGGVGLNLQFSSYVFLFDRWWNPALEDQAINRAHRIGAAGPVTVSRYLTVGTIEQRINEILEEKREIFDTIFANTDQPRNLGLTKDELFGLFKLDCPPPAAEAA